MAKTKEIKSKVKLLIQAGKATPAPPLGPVLGQNGVNIPQFCTEFNNLTSTKGDDMIPVILTVFKDTTFKIELKQPTVVSMLKKAAGIEKGSANPRKEKIGKVSKSQIKEIAERKLPDLNTRTLESAMNIVEGSARSLGLEVSDK